MSAVAILGGCLLMYKLVTVRTRWDRVSHPEGKAFFDAGVDALASVSRQVTCGLHNGSLQRYLFVMIASALVVGVVAFLSHDFSHGTREILPMSPAVVVGWFLLMGACGLILVKRIDRLLALILVNVIGLITSLIFIYFSAPDLALTQISVEVVTLILMLLALYFLPKRSIVEIPKSIRIRNGILAAAVGICAGGLTWATMTRDFSTISEYYWENSLPGSGGANVVNVILVDFRGFDTFGEIMVLGIAALMIYAILDGMLRGPLLLKLKSWNSGEKYSPNRHPLVMVVITRVMLPLSIMVAAFIFLRGHNAPGGGFIAALVVSIALIMQYMASGIGWAEKQVRYDYHGLIGAGGLIAAATGVSAMVFDLPFLTSGFEHFHLPILGDFELSSAIAFDLGVFLTVFGAVMLALAQLSRLGENTNREAINEEPMDYRPNYPDERRADSRIDSQAKEHV